MTQIHRGELCGPPILLDFHLLDTKYIEAHPLYETPLCSYVTPQKLYIKPIKENSRSKDLVFPHNSDSGTPLSISWEWSLKPLSYT